MEKFDRLANLSTTEYEAERCKIIFDYIATAPVEHRKKLLGFQMSLDNLRDQVSPEDFSKALMFQMVEMLENIDDQFTAIKNNLQKLAS